MYQAQRLAGLGQYGKALDNVDEAIAQTPKSAGLYALKGSLLYKMHQVDAAEAAWNRALELDPEAYDVKASLAWLKKHRAALDEQH